MTHLAFPNVHAREFVGLTRYLSLLPGQEPGPAYNPHPVVPRTPNWTAVHMAVEALVPEWLEQGYSTQVYRRVIGEDPGPARDYLQGSTGTSQDFAYLLALIRCARPWVSERVTDAGDVWCTGAIEQGGDRPRLAGLTRQDEFAVKLQAFCAQAHDHDRLFFVPAANVLPSERALCEAEQVQVLTLAAFRLALPTALACGSWPQPAVILVGTSEAPTLVATLFQGPGAQQHGPKAAGPSSSPLVRRQPYKFLDAFGLADTDLFFGRDQDLTQLQQKFAASQVLTVYGASGTGKTSLLQAGLLPSLPTEQYAWSRVRLVDDEPTMAIKAALVRDFALAPSLLAEPLLTVVWNAQRLLGKTVVIVLDQLEELFQRHAAPVRQRLCQELRACLDDLRLPLHIVIALREDYLARLAEFQADGAIPHILHENHIHCLTRFSPAQAREAIVRPAKQLGLPIDAALVEDVLLPQLTDAQEGTVELPMLQIVCDTWYQRVAEATLDNADKAALDETAYAHLGDIRTLFEDYLDKTLRMFGPERPQVQEVLKALVSAEDTARAVFRDELLSRLPPAEGPLDAQTLEHHVLRRLVQARLVRATDVKDRTRYELAHEFLIIPIAAWISTQERERTKMLELIERATEIYQATDVLLSPEALKRITPLLPELWPRLPEAQRSVLARSQQRARQQRRQQWRRVGVVVLAIILGGGASPSGSCLRRSEKQRPSARELWSRPSRPSDDSWRPMPSTDGRSCCGGSHSVPPCTSVKPTNSVRPEPRCAFSWRWLSNAWVPSSPPLRVRHCHGPQSPSAPTVPAS